LSDNKKQKETPQSKTRDILSFKVKYKKRGRHPSKELIDEHFNNDVDGYGGAVESLSELTRFVAEAKFSTTANGLAKMHDIEITKFGHRVGDSLIHLNLPFGIACKLRNIINDVLDNDERFSGVRKAIPESRVNEIVATKTRLTTLDAAPIDREAVTALYKERFDERFEDLHDMVKFCSVCQGKLLVELGKEWLGFEDAHFSHTLNDNDASVKLRENQPIILFDRLNDLLNGDERFSDIPENQRSEYRIREFVASQTTESYLVNLSGESEKLFVPIIKDPPLSAVEVSKCYEVNKLDTLSDVSAFCLQCENGLIDPNSKSALMKASMEGAKERVSEDDLQVIRQCLNDVLSGPRFKTIPECEKSADRINDLIGDFRAGMRNKGTETKINRGQNPRSLKMNGNRSRELPSVKRAWDIASEPDITHYFYNSKCGPKGRFEAVKEMVDFVLDCDGMLSICDVMHDHKKISGLEHKISSTDAEQQYLVGDDACILSEWLVEVFSQTNFKGLPADEVSRERIEELVTSCTCPDISLLSPQSAKIVGRAKESKAVRG